MITGQGCVIEGHVPAGTRRWWGSLPYTVVPSLPRYLDPPTPHPRSVTLSVYITPLETDQLYATITTRHTPGFWPPLPKKWLRAGGPAVWLAPPTELLKSYFQAAFDQQTEEGYQNILASNPKDCSSPEPRSATLDNMALSDPTLERLTEGRLSSLGLLDEAHMTTFRNALEKVLLIEVSESTYAEIIDGLPTLDSWNEFHYWVPGINPVVELEHKELCGGSRERAKKLRTEFDIYTLRFPTQVCSSINFVSQREGSECKRFRANPTCFMLSSKCRSQPEKRWLTTSY